MRSMFHMTLEKEAEKTISFNCVEHRNRLYQLQAKRHRIDHTPATNQTV